MKLTGGCHCGAIRYEAEAEPFNATLCHCTDCRLTAGAPVVAWFSVPPKTLRFVKGRPAVYASSARAERSFCAHCGTLLTFHYNGDERGIDVTTASLDDPTLAPPGDHVYFRSHLKWIETADALPHYATTRKAG